MSGTKISDAAVTGTGQRWAALDCSQERLVDASDPLLRELSDARVRVARRKDQAEDAGERSAGRDPGMRAAS